MDYPFQVGIDDNQTQAEKDHITELVTGEFVPLSEHTYKGRDGKERICDRVFLPKGCKVPAGCKLPKTVYYEDKEKTYYCTPFATKEDQILARISYIEDGKYHICNSEEWLKFCSGGTSEYTPLKDADPIAGKSGMMAMAKQQSSESEFSKDANWEKVEQRKMSKKKSSR